MSPLLLIMLLVLAVQCFAQPSSSFGEDALPEDDATYADDGADEEPEEMVAEDSEDSEETEEEDEEEEGEEEPSKEGSPEELRAMAQKLMAHADKMEKGTKAKKAMGY
jgi:hypothetical protein